MKKRGILTGAAVPLAAMLAGGFAWAGIPGAEAVIHGCYQNVEGQLRVIDPDTDSCRPSELVIAWNPRGDTGAPGDPGAPGKDGADGHDGISANVQTEPRGGENCSTGGAAVTTVSGVTYICNAPPPDPGGDG